ncbi:uncharacterized protein Z519_01213 [Cladophialophora bantiana CBS 173.52]|uniref:Unplaced genomic scaffold supercont1.2, whole genome shotgun sequence n=1 Tax=Cladophialophora bantiana (strain ATCC 10958 / CBS 173.52 / CDC B-1940 / NIH 8579) TaxID=1442370 RepID=A0A0D2ILF3_CLAB1|nr:uncharacterized protein Z519_01213 [Cladophialophora bantiana CBS 173.52]KIW97629.1 hypothetical protein Z519_01213 [Cladophialophora bantiana CBS 173.52]
MLAPKEEDLGKLAETCLSTARRIKQYLSASNHPQPSFDENGPSSFPAATPEIQQTRLELRTAARRLYDLASGPDDIVTWHLYHCNHDLNAFRYVYRYNVASGVPLNGTISYADLAVKLGLDASQLKQMLRQLMAIHVFTEPQPGHVGHTASSRLLATHAGIATFTGFLAEDTFPLCAVQVEALEKWGHGRPEPSRTALSYYYDTDLPCHDYYETNPAVRERFGRLMTHLTANPLMANSHISRGYEWESLPRDSVVVDVAGNAGHCAIPIAEATDPSVRIVVQDLPKVVASARDPETSVIPLPLRPRFDFMAHDYFTPQPVKGAAVYFLRMIIHNHSDALAVKVLRQIVPAMGPDSRILIMDQVMPPAAGLLPEPLERIKRSQDLQMMLLLNAKERDEAEWADLFAKAGEGLVQDVFAAAGDEAAGKGKKLGIVAIRTPPGSMMSLIEVGFVEGANVNGAEAGNTERIAVTSPDAGHS